MPGHKFEAPLLADGREEKYAFHPRESFTDADAGASAEGEISKFRAIVGLRPALRLKLFGVREPARIAVDHPRAHH